MKGTQPVLETGTKEIPADDRLRFCKYCNKKLTRYNINSEYCLNHHYMTQVEADAHLDAVELAYQTKKKSEYVYKRKKRRVLHEQI